MFTESAEYYDLIYSFKDYQKESEEILATIKTQRPGCKSVLDVGCGTAEHHKYLKDSFQMDGLDLNADFIRSAKAKNPYGSYHIGDMVSFDLQKKYDVITCLFSSIGYVKTFEKLSATLRNFHQHLNDNGLVIVEPWLTPNNWTAGKLHLLTHDKEDLKICRMHFGESSGKISILNFQYLLGRAGKGVEHFTERHELALFSKEEMISAFEAAGFAVTHDEQGLIGRGMYYGAKKEAG